MRLGSVRLLVASPEDIGDLWNLVAEWARAHLRDELHRGNPERICRAAWTLQRAARSRDDVAMGFVHGSLLAG